MRTYFLTLALVAFLGTMLIPRAIGASALPPNILIILSDDMGFSDLGCYGGEIRTPNLDRLARGGLRFAQFYNTARCCPTRAALLTGLYPHQTGVGHMMADKGSDGYRGDLNRRCVTIPEVLRPAGYRSYAVGKWHVTRHAQPEGPKHSWPLQRGFDRFYGTIAGAGNYFDPSALTRDNTMLVAGEDPEYQPQQYYYTDAISDHAVRFIADHRRDHRSQPFFLYVAYTAAHWPIQALPKDSARYRGKYDGGYEPIRAARFAKAKSVGLIDSKWEITPPVGHWNEVTNKAWEARGMEVYAAMVDRMDQGIGRIVAELKKQKIFENTLILYLQDNGGCAETVGRAPDLRRPDRPAFPPLKPGEIETTTRPKQTRDGWPMLSGQLEMPGPRDTFMAYGRAWAHVSNTPFREYKHWVHEGGIATPLIAHWPKGIKAGRGSFNAANGSAGTRRPSSHGPVIDTPGHLIDLMATCVDLAGAKYPAERDGQQIQPLEGVSLRPLFEGKGISRSAPIFFEHEGNRAVRDGQWKLVAKGPAGRWELYDLEADRTEMHDLAGAQPGRVKSMVAQWEAWAKRTGVLPWIWKPAYGEKEVAPSEGEKPPIREVDLRQRDQLDLLRAHL